MTHGIYADVEPEAKVMDIPVGMKQKVEILKALVRGAKILIMDEPTAVLTSQETAELFVELKNLKNQGYTIVFISHKLNEIMEITDRLTIMRNGRSMGVYNTCDVTKEEISRLMVGRDVVLSVQKDRAVPGDTVLRVRGLYPWALESFKWLTTAAHSQQATTSYHLTYPRLEPPSVPSSPPCRRAAP